MVRASRRHHGMFEDAGQFGQSLVGVGHFDGVHAKGAGWLEIDAEVIEEDRLLGAHAEGCAGEFIEAGIGFAYPQDADSRTASKSAYTAATSSETTLSASAKLLVRQAVL